MSELSILFLRFEDLIVSGSMSSRSPFNSLFEILLRWRTCPRKRRRLSFNSLFEILGWPTWPLRDSRKLAFNSLFEIRQSKGLGKQLPLVIFQFSFWDSPSNFSSTLRLNRGSLSILFLRFALPREPRSRLPRRSFNSLFEIR